MSAPITLTRGAFEGTLVNVFPSSADSSKGSFTASLAPRSGPRGTPASWASEVRPAPPAADRRASRPGRPRRRRPHGRGRGLAGLARSRALGPAAPRRRAGGQEAAELVGLRPVERVDHREREHALAQVLSRLLAERLLARGEVHDVVGELEGEAERSPNSSRTSRAGAGASESIPPSRHEVAISARLAPITSRCADSVCSTRPAPPPRGSARRRASRSSARGARRCRCRARSRSPRPGRTGSRPSGSRRCCPAHVRRGDAVTRIRLVDHVVVVQGRLVDEPRSPPSRPGAGRSGRRSTRRAARASRNRFPPASSRYRGGLGQHLRVGAHRSSAASTSSRRTRISRSSVGSGDPRPGIIRRLIGPTLPASGAATTT